MSKAINLNMKADEFVELVVPEEASDTQKIEIKKAFLTGMSYGFKLPTTLALDDLSEEEAMSLLFNYNTQIDLLELALKSNTVEFPKRKGL